MSLIELVFARPLPEKGDLLHFSSAYREQQIFAPYIAPEDFGVRAIFFIGISGESVHCLMSFENRLEYRTFCRYQFVETDILYKISNERWKV